MLAAMFVSAYTYEQDKLLSRGYIRNKSNIRLTPYLAKQKVVIPASETFSAILPSSLSFCPTTRNRHVSNQIPKQYKHPKNL